jgi:hypothetical protein
MMAANAANDGSGRCQPKFMSDDEYRKMVIRNPPTPQRGNERPKIERRPSIGYMRIAVLLNIAIILSK